MTWVVVVVAVVVVALAMAVTAWAAHRTGRWAVVDVTWGSGFVVVAVVSALVGDGDVLRRVLLGLLPAIWGIRLASHIFTRAQGKEDARYQKLKDDGGSLVRNVLLPQGAVMWFVSLPVQIGVGSDRGVTWLGWVGVAVWLVGMGFEVVGDRQLTAFKADPANKGTIMDRGLWGWTRHPNYFGDACLWWGVWLVAADSGWAGAATVLSPVAMTFFIRNVTGAKLLEKTMSRRDGWSAYAARVPLFFPRPPFLQKGG